MPSPAPHQPGRTAGTAALRAGTAALLLACAQTPQTLELGSPPNPASARTAGVIPARAPELILHNGIIFAAGQPESGATAIAVTGDRITAVGADAELMALADAATTTIDLEGRLVIPGLNDSHMHVGPWPEMRVLGLSGPEDPSWGTVLDSVRAAAAEVPAGTWISGEIGASVLDDTAATRFGLDSVSSEHPVMLSGFTGHGLVVNSAALRALDISLTEPDRPGGWFDRVTGSDTLNGRLWEYTHLDVIRRLSAPPSREDAIASYRNFADWMVRWGVTSVQQMENDRDLNETLAALAEARLPLRWAIYEWPMPERSVDEPRPPVRRPSGLDERVRVAGVKWMLDGTPVERGAAMRAPYSDRSSWYGRVNFSPDEIRQILGSALQDGDQTALHVAGDSTLALVLRTMFDLAPAESWRAHRVRIEHGDGTTPDLLPLMEELGVVLVQNPLHLALPQFLHPRYGAERTPQMQLLASAARGGVPVALGTDAAGSGRNPWLNLMLATIHPSNAAEALTREEALRAFTFGSAWAEGHEDRKGTLAPGMLADMVVLSQNVLEVPLDALPATESALTIIGGEIVYRAPPFQD